MSRPFCSFGTMVPNYIWYSPICSSPNYPAGPVKYRVWPVMQRESSETRNTTPGAIWVGNSTRPKCVGTSMPSFTNPLACVPSEEINPGFTELTRILRSANSFANVRVRLSTADLVASLTVHRKWQNELRSSTQRFMILVRD